MQNLNQVKRDLSSFEGVPCSSSSTSSNATIVASTEDESNKRARRRINPLKWIKTILPMKNTHTINKNRINLLLQWKTNLYNAQWTWSPLSWCFAYILFDFGNKCLQNSIRNNIFLLYYGQSGMTLWIKDTNKWKQLL